MTKTLTQLFFKEININEIKVKYLIFLLFYSVKLIPFKNFLTRTVSNILYIV